ncbi:MAG: TerB family tellurite resistance protein [Chloroflexota bacterium]
MSWRHYLGMQEKDIVERPAPLDASGQPVADADAEAEVIRRISAQLDAMPEDRARYLAGFAYILSRAALADLDVTEAETAQMERTVVEVGAIPEAEAVLVVEMAKTQSRLYGATEDYIITRDWSSRATTDQKLGLLRACYLVGAANGSISAEENATLSQIANEFGLDADEVKAVRSEFYAKLSVVQAFRAQQADGPG